MPHMNVWVLHTIWTLGIGFPSLHKHMQTYTHTCMHTEIHTESRGEVDSKLTCSNSSGA